MKIYHSQLSDVRTGKAIDTAGGMCYVSAPGHPEKMELFARDGTALTNPVALVNGSLDFTVSDSVKSVDLYIMAPTGHFVVVRGVTPSGNNDIFIDRSQMHQAAVVPFYAPDGAIASDVDTGFILPLCLLTTDTILFVSGSDAGETLNVGVTGAGTALMSAVSVASQGPVKGATSASVLVVGKKNILYQLSAGSDTAAGYIILPYLLAV